MSARLAVARALTPIGLELPAVRFFKPTSTFFDLMAEFLGHAIYDVGSGTGHVAAALAENGHAVNAIDIATRAGQAFKTAMANGASITYAPRSIVMFCRPSHGAYFVGPCIENAIECDTSAIIYVGFEGNLHDVDPFKKRFKRESVTFIGEDGESMWVWRRRILQTPNRSATPGVRKPHDGHPAEATPPRSAGTDHQPPPIAGGLVMIKTVAYEDVRIGDFIWNSHGNAGYGRWTRVNGTQKRTSSIALLVADGYSQHGHPREGIGVKRGGIT